MSNTYETRFKANIGEVFKEDNEVMEKLYHIMGKEGMSKERNDLFFELVSTMERLKEEMQALSEINQRQQKQLEELSDKKLNTLIVEQAKDIAATAKDEYNAAKETFTSTKDRIVSNVKDTLKQYYKRGKAGLRSGVSKLISGIRSMHINKISAINARVRKRNEHIERLDAIEKELAATKGQLKNLFRTVFGREKRYDESASSAFLNSMKKELEYLNDKDVKLGERILLSNKALERLNERFGQKEKNKKSPLDTQLASAKAELHKNQEKTKEFSYQKNPTGKMPPLSRT